MTHQTSRRDFLRQSAVASLSLAAGGYFTSRAAAQPDSPNEKLNVACIGVMNRGAANVSGVRSENMVAICDIDDNYLEEVARSYPGASKYADYRKMLEQADIEAVVISTPDHTHAPATMAALKLGKHVYCEKPLTHTVSEARLVTQTAKEMNVATQMGTQIHAEENYRRVVEIIQSGAIGPIREVHVWVDTNWSGGDLPTETPSVPDHIHWDLWLGTAPARPYHPTYLPANWRRWWDFGSGTLGDMACHYMDLPFWALGLQRPTSVVTESSPLNPETAATGLKVTYEYPARGDQPPLQLTWYDGELRPRTVAGHRVGGAGVMFVGAAGEMFANYSSYTLYPEEKFADYQPPAETIPRSIGHHQEWIKACKDGTPTTCNFDYSGPLTEAVLLGNVAYRTGKKIDWDAETLVARGVPEADELIHHKYRGDWGA